MIRKSRLLMLTTIIASVLPATSVEARRVWPVVGASPGDATVTAQCPAGQVLVGLAGRAGTWIDQVQLICAVPIANGTFSPPTAGSDRLGGTGGGPQMQVCDRNSKIQAAKIDLTADAKRVGSIMLVCVASDGSQTTLNFGQIGGSSRAVKKCGGPFTGCDAGEIDRSIPQQSCPQEQFVGITVRFGHDINSIGFICDIVRAALPIRTTGRPRPS